MPSMKPLLDALNEGHREFEIALTGLADEDLWTRPHPRLWSVGELAAHIGYARAIWVLGGGSFRPDLALLPIQSPLIDRRFSYYAGGPQTGTVLDMTVAEVVSEVARIHEVCNNILKSKKIDEVYEGQWGTWGALVQYQVFHVAYHTGQIYSVRHLMGHETEDN